MWAAEKAVERLLLATGKIRDAVSAAAEEKDADAICVTKKGIHRGTLAHAPLDVWFSHSITIVCLSLIR